MMRTLIAVLILAVLLVIAGLATGFLDIDQIRGARAPEVSATGNGVAAQGGQAPAFEVKTGKIGVGSTNANVTVPTITVTPAQDPPAAAAAVSNNIM